MRPTDVVSCRKILDRGTKVKSKQMKKEKRRAKLSQINCTYWKVAGMYNDLGESS